MLYSCQGLTLLYDLPHVPAPQGDQPWDKGVSFTVMLKLANVSNAVTVSYSVDGGPTQQLHAVAGESDYRENAQYFAVAFPKLSVGQGVQRCCEWKLCWAAGTRVDFGAKFCPFVSSYI